MSSKKVSIIVPCYKVEEYLPRCLDSLVNQTLDGVEAICINDGSPDGCIDILRDYEQRYPGTVVIIDKENEGVWRGRWDGIRIASGEYIGFVDSDDYVEPDFAESLYTTARSADADLAVGGFERVDMITGKTLSREMCTPRKSFNVRNEPGRLIELNGAPWNKLFRANILKNMRDLTSPPPVLDDLVFHLLAYLDMDGLVAFTPKCLVHYMVRSDSIINTITQEKLHAGYDAFIEVKQYYEKARVDIPTMQALDVIAFLHLGISMNFRLSYDTSLDLKELITTSIHFLDAKFPTWRHSPYLSLSYVLRNKGAFTKLYIVHIMFRMHMIRGFLALYRFAIEKLKIDIKW